MIVGALTGFLRGKAAPEEFLPVIERMFRAHERPVPAFLDAAFVARFAERMRRLLGRWRATKAKEPMELL